jgi:hypothetical protein
MKKTTPPQVFLFFSEFSSQKLLLFVNIGIVVLLLVGMFFGHSANPKKKETKEAFQETFEETFEETIKATNDNSLDSSFSEKKKMEEEYQNYNYQPQMAVSNPDINSDNSYNTLDNYNDSIHFQVSYPRAKALEAQVSRCEGPYPLQSPETLMKKQKYNCKSYLCRGGYDANKWDEGEQ